MGGAGGEVFGSETEADGWDVVGCDLAGAEGEAGAEDLAGIVGDDGGGALPEAEAVDGVVGGIEFEHAVGVGGIGERVAGESARGEALSVIIEVVGGNDLGDGSGCGSWGIGGRSRRRRCGRRGGGGGRRRSAGSGRGESEPGVVAAEHVVDVLVTVIDEELGCLDAASAGFAIDDSGLDGEFIVVVLEEAGVSVDWTKAQDAIGGGGVFQEVDIVIDRLTLGSDENEVVQSHVPGTASEHPPSVLGDTLGFHLGGLISHQFFRDHALTFDFTRMRLVMR